MSHNLIPPGCGGVVWALLELRWAAMEREGQSNRLRLNVGLVLDRSGSMSGRPLEYVKAAAAFVVEHVGTSLVTFDSEVATVCPSRQVTGKERLKSVVIDGIRPCALHFQSRKFPKASELCLAKFEGLKQIGGSLHEEIRPLLGYSAQRKPP